MLAAWPMMQCLTGMDSWQQCSAAGEDRKASNGLVEPSFHAERVFLIVLHLAGQQGSIQSLLHTTPVAVKCFQCWRVAPQLPLSPGTLRTELSFDLTYPFRNPTLHQRINQLQLCSTKHASRSDILGMMLSSLIMFSITAPTQEMHHVLIQY